jgi:CheY-like chemotaxis protein
MMFTSRTAGKNLRLLMEWDEETVPRHIVADAGKLRQILMNLMGNAVKFTETGGIAIRIRARAVAAPVSEAGGNKRLEFEVEDTGPGISAADIDRIFDAFLQTEAGARAGGTGLGLAISRQFVEMMGGKLSVASKPGTGSCFKFDILVEAAEGAPEQVKPAMRTVIGLAPGTKSHRILIVDDIQDNRALLSAFLRPVGFTILEARDGEEALAIFAEQAPDAVLMDMRMPMMDGYEATRRIKATAAGRATPVIAITASAFDDAREEVMETGVDGYLRKPFRHEEVFEALGNSLHLQYVYAEPAASAIPREPSSGPANHLAALPADLVQAMQAALSEGDMARLRELIAQAAASDAAAARQLQDLAAQYDYEQIERLLKTSEVNHG